MELNEEASNVSQGQKQLLTIARPFFSSSSSCVPCSTISPSFITRIISASLDSSLLLHGEITGYIFYNMLKADGGYTDTELAEYTLIGMLDRTAA